MSMLLRLCDMAKIIELLKEEEEEDFFEPLIFFEESKRYEMVFDVRDRRWSILFYKDGRIRSVKYDAHTDILIGANVDLDEDLDKIKDCFRWVLNKTDLGAGRVSEVEL